MASLNRVFLIGNLTRDPELKYIPSGKAVCTLRLASTERYKTTSGEAREDTLFVDAVVWGRQAENCSTYLKKGRPVFVEGRLRIREYDARDGSKRKVTEVVANRVQFLGSRQDGVGTGGGRDEGAPRDVSAPDEKGDSGGADAPEEPLPSFDEEA